MTQRSIQHPQHATAHRAAPAGAGAVPRTDAIALDTVAVALASLVLVVVLITTLTGAG